MERLAKANSKIVDAKQARLITLIELFKSLDLSKPLPEAYEKIVSEYHTFKELIAELDEYILSEEENRLFQEMIAEDERKRFESKLKDK